MTEELYNKLRVMQAYHLRTMARVTRAHVREHEISTVDLATELDIDHIDCHLARRQLRYAGHVARMPLTRLPRRMLSAWVPRRRPVGAPAMTYGRALRSQLEWFGVDIRRWSELAADRGAQALRRSSRRPMTTRRTTRASLSPRSSGIST